jgi:GNAT superfamily N-acetyltransferase
MTPQELAQLEEHRIAEAVADVALESIRLEGGGTVCWGGDGSWINEGRGLAMRGEVPPGEVDRAIGFLRERGARVRFDVCPYAHPSLLERLGERGLVALGFETVLYRELDPLDLGPSVGGVVAGIEIRPVDGEEDVPAFVDGVGRWFSPAGELREVDEWAMRRVLAHPRVEGFLVQIDGRMVGGGALEMGLPESGLAVLMMTSVDPAWRRRGVQNALMVHRLRRARELGACVAAIGSDPSIATGRNAMRLGFRVAYTKVSIGQPAVGGA